MSDSIDREELKKAAKRIESLPWGDEEGNRVEFEWTSKELEFLIDKAPSAEKKGKWILDPDGMDWNIPAWRCSECGFVATHIGVELNGLGDNPLNWAGSKFCPQCGARITGYER